MGIDLGGTSRSVSKLTAWRTNTTGHQPTCLPYESTYEARVRRFYPIILLFIAACGSAATAPVREYTGPLHAPRSYASADFAIDHRITAIHAEGQESFRALLEKAGDSLTIVGLGPHGSRAFTLTQEGTEVRFESNLPRELPFPPRYVLIDVHRTWLVGLDRVLPDGNHESTTEESGEVESILDTWADGRLIERTFRPVGETDGVIHIRYEGGLSPDPSAPSPTRIELENERFGYRLVMENITRTAI